MLIIIIPPACGIEYDYNLADGSSTIKKVIPIAGEFSGSHGPPLDPVLTRLKNSPSHGDANKEGVRVELNGGRYPFDKSSGQSQKAIIEFQCDPTRTGLEGLENDSREKDDDESPAERRSPVPEGEKKDGNAEDGGDGKGEGEGDGQGDKDESSLTLVSYRVEGEADREAGVLRLNWKTKYACEGQTAHKPSSSSSGWGFFTWFLIMYVHSSPHIHNPLPTDSFSQRLPAHLDLFDLWFMAKLQPLRS